MSKRVWSAFVAVAGIAGVLGFVRTPWTVAQIPPVPRPVVVAPPVMRHDEPTVLPQEQGLPGTPAAAGELNGKVVNPDGKPMAGVTIRVWTWVDGRDKQTADDGTFKLKLGNNNDRKVEIRFTKEGWCPRYITHQPTGLADLVVTMDRDTYVEGQVLNPDGNPVPNAKVRADQGPKQLDGVLATSIWTETTADAEGRYRLYVQPDVYAISVRDARVGAIKTGKLPVNHGDHLTRDLRLEPGITFGALVVDAVTGAPVPDVKLSNFRFPEVVGISDTAGHVSIAAMDAGPFQFDVQAKGYVRWWSDQAVNEFERYQVKPGSFQRNFDYLSFEIKPATGDVLITLEPGVTVRGTAVDPNGKPAAKATVAPADTGTGNSLTGDTRFSVKTNPDGTFEMLLPASGEREYNLVVHDDSKPRQWANGVLPPFSTKPGETVNSVRIALTTPATVKGRVVDKDGNPVAKRQVRAQAIDRMENRYYDPTTRTDDNGEFTLKCVRAGEQSVECAPFWFAGQAPLGTSMALHLAEGQTITDVVLTAAPERQ